MARPPPPPAPPPPPLKTTDVPVKATEQPAPAASSSVERVKAKESFEPNEPLPAFTFPAIDEATKQELLKSVEAAAAASSVERVKAKESFEPNEPLPAFTFPVLDEEKKQELLQRVEDARTGSAQAKLPPPPRAAGRVTSPGPRFDAAQLIGEVRRRALGVWGQISASARRWIDAACASIDRTRSRLPARVREPIREMPSGVILATAGVLVLGIVAGILALIVRRPTEQSPKPNRDVATLPSAAKEDPVPREIEQAKQHGALEELAQKFPNDSRVWLAVAENSSAKADHPSAVGAVGKALAADPKANEQRVASDVLALAVRKRGTTDSAFELLQGSMGSAGATVLYDLSIDPNVPIPLRTRAEEWIRSEAFQKAATPDVGIAGALRYARSCSERHQLLPRAAEAGERRTLDFLNVAKAPAGCGRNARKDCFPCLRKDSALKDAMTAIQKRLAGG